MQNVDKFIYFRLQTSKSNYGFQSFRNNSNNGFLSKNFYMLKEDKYMRY